MSTKYETLLALAKNVCDGVRNYYSAKNEMNQQKEYLFVWEQVYLLAQILINTIRYTETSDKYEASGKAFVCEDPTVCKHGKEVVDAIDAKHEAVHKAVETFMKKLVEAKVVVADEYAEASMIRYVKALIVGNLNNAAKQAEKDDFKYSEPEMTIVIEEMVETKGRNGLESTMKNDSYVRDFNKEHNQKKEKVLDYVVSEFIEILYAYLENHPEDKVFIQERYLNVLVNEGEIKKGKDIAKVLNISGAAVSKKIAKYDDYFAKELKKHLEEWM